MKKARKTKLPARGIYTYTSDYSVVRMRSMKMTVNSQL